MHVNTKGTIVAHRWFDGTNTYHKVYLYPSNGTERIVSDVTYGYGNAFETTAIKLARANGYDLLPLSDWHWHVCDVTRKRDL